MRRIIKIFLFMLGLSLSFYPLISGIFEQRDMKNTVTTYEQQLAQCESTVFEECIEKAYSYNSILYQSKDKMIDSRTTEILKSENYNQILNLTGNGMMGSIEIPKINVNLPIYHGTSEEVLATGVGHIEGTSLPVGGESTRTVLSGHRGLPNSKLFTRLDELEIGDFFFIRIMDEILAYEVTAIDIIKPDNTEKIKIVPEKDLATLLTCTPYGLNTHRLLVTGERVEYVENDYQSMKKEMMSFRELLFAVMPFVVMTGGFINAIKECKLQRQKMKRKKLQLYKENEIC